MLKVVIIFMLVCVCAAQSALDYTRTPGICDESVTAPYGSITSPNYPENYINFLDCYYTITTSPDTAVTLEFVDFFMEPRYDYVIIYDGPSTSSPWIGKYSDYGPIRNDVILYATTNVVLVYFHTDISGDIGGFNISFYEREKCDQTVQGSYGTIASPGFPTRPYPSNRDCVYKITTSPGTTVYYEIVYMGLQQYYDYLDVFSGPSTGSWLIGTYTGMQSKVIGHVSSNDISMHFHSEINLEYPGFYITFREWEATNCPSSYYNANSGSISSPSFPQAYQSGSDCFYLISTAYNTQVILDISHVDIELTNHCVNDYVEFFDGALISDKSLAKVCGTGPVPPIISTNNVVLAHFHSHNGTQGHHNGFHANYRTNACPAPIYLDGDSGTISSPGYPNSHYTNSANCTFFITTPAGSQVVLHINYLRMEFGSDYCPYDSLKIYDGFQNGSPLLANLCGVKGSNDYQASTNLARIEFLTDSSVTDAGFSLTYTAVFN